MPYNLSELDIRTILKASQALSSEIILDKLLKKFLNIIIENSGAQRGFLILKSSDEFLVEGEININSGETIVRQSVPLNEAKDIAVGVVNYVKRTLKNVVLDNAAQKSIFSSDSYIKKNKVKSILCIPILRASNLVGILYIENNLTSGAFTPQRQEILKMLATQAAISLENAILYEELYETYNDIRKTEEELKNSEEKYRDLYESAPNAYFSIKPDQSITGCNNAAVKLLGYSKEELIRMNVFEIYSDSPEGLPKAKKIFKKFIEGKPIQDEELQMRHKNGNPIWVSLTVEPVKNQKGQIIESRSMVIDITERKMAEEELINLHNLKSELMSRTSHELKTPLTSIKGFTQLLMTQIKGKIDDKIFSYFDHISKGIKRLENLIRSIIKTSELSTGIVKLKKTYENLASLVNLSVKDLEGFAISRNHTISVDIHDSLMTKFENEQIHQVLNNLIGNAIKYTPPNGKIEIKSQIKEKFYIISIKDNGIGFIQDEKSRIFKQFGKIEHFGKDLDVYSEGSGLGLYISKKIIELHDGNIWMESEGRNKGSTFYFSLPLI